MNVLKFVFELIWSVFIWVCVWLGAKSLIAMYKNRQVKQ